MSLLEIYKEKNEDRAWFKDHSSLSSGMHGRMFEYTDTNFRTQNTFTKSFLNFLKIENKIRNNWPKNSKNGQELHKHYVIPMVQAKLFKKDANGLFNRTMKGILYTNFIKLKIKETDKWFLNYIFLLNGYFSNRKNYILDNVKEYLLGCFLSTEEITEESIIIKAKELLKETSFKKIIRTDFFYLHSFYNDSEFLTLYLRSTKNEKEDLSLYIENNIKTKNFNCCISKKYQLSGNFNTGMLLDETRVFLMTLLFNKEKGVDLANIYGVFYEIYNKNINKLNKKILNYLYENRGVFDQIFRDILEEDSQDNLSNNEFVDKVKLSNLENLDIPESYIDETDEQGRLKIKTIFNIRKKQAHLISGYKCALEAINNCPYFTAKSNGENYLELHHLIPQEFRNDFSYSIEVLANYVTLCPRCHKQIHLAVDRERVHLINLLYKDRNARLNLVGLKLDLNKIYEYYYIDR
jgi:5-methylcytosine-specific restriction protein A